MPHARRIFGAGRDATIIDAARKGRVFNVARGSNVRLEGLTITGGRVQIPQGNDPSDPPYGLGGGMTNRGDLTLWNVAVVGNELIGAPGHAGAAGANGTAGKTGANGRNVNCGRKRGNCADPIFAGYGQNGTNGANGEVGTRGGSVWGGGLWSNGRLTVVNSLFKDNRAVGGAGGKGGDGGQGGAGGNGGRSGYLTINAVHPDRPIFRGDYCVARPGGIGGEGAYGGYGNHGGRGGSARGGAIYAHTRGQNDVTIVNTQFLHNTASGGAGGAGGTGGFGAKGGAGGAAGSIPASCKQMPDTDRSRGRAGVDRSAVQTGNGEDGKAGYSAGGAYFTWNPASPGTVMVQNVVVAGNSAQYGGGFGHHGAATLNHGTIVGNYAEHQGGGMIVDALAPEAPQITNTLIWANTIGRDPLGDNNAHGTTTQYVRERAAREGTVDPVIAHSCVEGFSSGAGNIDGCSNPGLPRPVRGEIRFAPDDPKLIPGVGSPLIDAGDSELIASDIVDLDQNGSTATVLPLDLRGAARNFRFPFRTAGMAPLPATARPDIGAYEAFVEIKPWNIGQPITPPAEALVQGLPMAPPEISPIPARNRFYWDPVGKSLTPVDEYTAGPVTITWKVPDGSKPSFSYGRPVWPDDAHVLVAGAAMDLTPGADDPLRFFSHGNPLDENAEYQPSLSGLAAGEARLVTYLPRDARNLGDATPRFVILRGAPAAELASGTDACRVGSALAQPDGTVDGLRFVVGPSPVIDTRAGGYDLASQTGVILPVSPFDAVGATPLQVAWYRPGPMGIALPNLVLDYKCRWPDDAEALNPGDLAGVALDGFETPQLVHQPDPAKPGFHKNTAHATLAQTADGLHLFALRNAPGAHVLLRHQSGDGQAAYRVFRLTEPESTATPLRHELGQSLEAIPALAHLNPQSCDETTVDGPHVRDHTGVFWPTGEAELKANWQYRVGPDMATDLDGDGAPDVEAGACLPWLGAPGEVAEPVAYAPKWPDETDRLSVGQSFDLSGAAAVRLVAGQDNNARLLPIGRALAAPLAEVPDAAKPDLQGWLLGLPGTLKDRLQYTDGQLRLRGAVRADDILINRLSATELTLAKSIAPDDAAWAEALETLAAEAASDAHLKATTLVGEDALLITGAVTGTGPVALLLNDDPDAGTAVSMRILDVSCPAHVAPLQMMRPTSLFEPGVTFAYGADFGGETDRLQFEWRRQSLNDLSKAARPVDLSDAAWVGVPGDGAGRSVLNIPAGDPGVLQNTAVTARYTGFEDVCGPSEPVWSGVETGTESGMPRPLVAQSWIAMVAERVNAFEARQTDLAESGEPTATSLIALAGRRYESDVQLTSEGALDAGLIEIYETVLNRATRLAFGGQIAAGAGMQGDLAQVAGRLGDLYRALGNEAVSDALDPSIVSTSEMADDRNRASSAFAFSSVLTSRLDEELVLLRGRNDTTGPTAQPPTYNRLRWALDSGERADGVYALTYGIEPVTLPNGQRTQSPLEHARALYPQGHGDAWGHYLSGMKYFYDLMRTPGFAWQAQVNLSEGSDGAVSLTTSSEEEIFTSLAAERANTGARIVDLQFRQGYTEDPIARLLGFPGSAMDQDSAWGLTDWARRAGQGAYLDWLALNAALPAPDCAGCGDATILTIDRTTVPDLAQLPEAFNRTQLTLERAAAGMTPLGLPQNVVPFGLDLDLRVYSKEGHFGQIYETALKEVQKARSGLSRVELAMRDLRTTRMEEAQRVREVAEREAASKRELVELYGRPYPEDLIGSNRTYPASYDGPDIHNYDLTDIDAADMFGDSLATASAVGLEVQRVDGLTDLFLDPSALVDSQPFSDPKLQSLMQDGQSYVIDRDKLAAFQAASTERADGDAPQLKFVFSPELGLLQKPERFTRRPKYGELQYAKVAFLREFGLLRQQLLEYDQLAASTHQQLDLLKARIRGQEGELAAQADTLAKVTRLQTEMIDNELVQVEADYAAQSASEIAQVMSGPGGAWAVGLTGASIVSRQVAAVAQIQRSRAQNQRERVEMTGQLRLIAGEAREWELLTEATQLFETAQRHQVLREGLRVQDIAVREAEMRYFSLLADAEREMAALIRFRQETAADTQAARYADGVNRLLRDEAVEAYEAQLDQAARYVYLAAKAYEYETGRYGFGDRF
ncbi:MAG: hypothetical protein AAFY31_00390, partial [Pseudomonadota bacterium]